jgi:hypothetical protein
VNPVVIGARQFDGPVAADDLAESKAGAGVEHGRANAHFFKKQLPAFAPHVGESALGRKMSVGIVQMINGRERTSAAGVRKTSTYILLGHVLPNRGDVFHHVAVAVNDFVFCSGVHISP